MWAKPIILSNLWISSHCRKVLKEPLVHKSNAHLADIVIYFYRMTFSCKFFLLQTGSRKPVHTFYELQHLAILITDTRHSKYFFVMKIQVLLCYENLLFYNKLFETRFSIQHGNLSWEIVDLIKYKSRLYLKFE